MTKPLKFGDVIQIKFPMWWDWVAYIRGAVPSLLGAGEDYLLRFAHQQSGLMRFLQRDLSEPEIGPGDYPIPDSQSMVKNRIEYHFQETTPEPIPQPEPPTPGPQPQPDPGPTPQPEPEPSPEPDVTITTTTVPSSMVIIFGDWGEANVPIMLVGANGNIQQVLTGSKTEHGAGGFEFLVYSKGLHLLSIAGHQFNIWITEDGRAVKVTFHKGQQEMVRLMSKTKIARRWAMMIIDRYPNCGFTLEEAV